MKLLVAVIMFVVIPFVFAEDVTWESVPDWPLPPDVNTYQSVPPSVGEVAGQTEPQVKAQNSQGNAGNPMALNEPPSSDPHKDQSDALYQRGEEELKIAREANGIAREDKNIQAELARIGWLTILSQIILVAVQICFIRAANKHAGDAARAAKDSVEVADRSMRIANRAYLFVDDWKTPAGLREHEKTTATCGMKNAGRTPATLEKRYGWCCLLAENPSPLTPACLNNVKQEEFVVNVDGEAFTTFDTPHIGTVEYRALTKRAQFLHATICFVYRDVFDQRYWVVSSAVYDMGVEAFRIVDGREYNCHGLYREEDWIDKENKQ